MLGSHHYSRKKLTNDYGVVVILSTNWLPNWFQKFLSKFKKTPPAPAVTRKAPPSDFDMFNRFQVGDGKNHFENPEPPPELKDGDWTEKEEEIEVEPAFPSLEDAKFLTDMKGEIFASEVFGRFDRGVVGVVPPPCIGLFANNKLSYFFPEDYNYRPLFDVMKKQCFLIVNINDNVHKRLYGQNTETGGIFYLAEDENEFNLAKKQFK